MAAAQHVCAQVNRLAELEKRAFPDSVEPFKFFMEDALFKQNMSMTVESLANSTSQNTADILNLRERSDTKDDAAKDARGKLAEDARSGIAQHARECPVAPRVEAMEAARKAFYEKEFAPLRDDNLKRSWIQEYAKPAVMMVVGYILLEIVKRSLGI